MSLYDAALRVRGSSVPERRRSLGWGLNAVALTSFFAGAATCVDPGVAALPAGFEPTLLVLIRFMAVAKLAMAVGAFALVHWRARRIVPPGLALAYAVATCLMLASPGLIWSLAHIGLGALAFHAGLILFLGGAWVDDCVLASRLGAGKRLLNSRVDPGKSATQITTTI